METRLFSLLSRVDWTVVLRASVLPALGMALGAGSALTMFLFVWALSP